MNKRHPLSKKEWQQVRKLAASASFLVQQGYIPYEMGASNFVYDLCPQMIKDAWKVKQLDYHMILELLCECSEYAASVTVRDAVKSVPTSGLDSKILKDCALPMDQDLTARSIAAKYFKE